MKFVTRFILAFLIFSLNFDREGHAALNSGDVATPLYVQNFSVSGQATRPRGITFNNDGSKMYIIGTGSDAVHEFNLTTNFNVESFSFSQSFSVSAQELSPTQVKFNNDGSKMFIVGGNTDQVEEYILTKSFDISTATHESSFNIGTEEATAYGLDFSTDGKMMYVSGLTSAKYTNIH